MSWLELPGNGSGYGTTKRGGDRRERVPLAVPLSGRRTVDKIRPHVGDVRTSACDVEYTDAPK
jgi:hypothetical protein